MRRPVLITAVIAASLLLAACGGDSKPLATASSTPGAETPTAAATAAPPTKADVAALAGVKVAGALGAEPKLDFTKPFTTSAPVARVDTEGTGDVLAEGQSLDINYSMVSGEDGSALASTWTNGKTETITMGDPQMVSALNDVLADQRVGVRILAALPGTAATASAAAQPATILVLEVLGARDVPKRAEGEAVTPPAGLPTVKLADSGEPSITIPADAVKPTKLVVQPLIKGAGAVVASGQKITVHYSGWLWDGGTPFDSSWSRGTPMQSTIDAGQLIAGWDQGLVGQTVGSQVLLVIPPDLAYKEAGSGTTIPPNATLVFVVDILDAR